MFYGDDIKYARQRLNETYVQYDGKVVLVKDIEGRGKKSMAIIEAEDDGKLTAVPLADLNIRSLNIGYVNSRFGACYFCRKPMREDWRQGHRDRNTFNIGGRAHLSHMSKGELTKAVNNNYPSLKEAFDISKMVGSAAFNKKFALTSDGHLLYRDHMIGSITLQGDYSLANKYTYLNEYVQEVVNGK